MRSRLPEPTTGVDVWRRRPQPPNPRGNTNSNTTRSPVSPWACRGAKGCWGLKFAGAIAGFGEWVRRGQLVRYPNVLFPNRAVPAPPGPHRQAPGGVAIPQSSFLSRALAYHSRPVPPRLPMGAGRVYGYGGLGFAPWLPRAGLAVAWRWLADAPLHRRASAVNDQLAAGYEG